eukprot:CFRG2481T1
MVSSLHSLATYFLLVSAVVAAEICLPTADNELGPLYSGYAPEKEGGVICEVNVGKIDLYTASSRLWMRSTTHGFHELVVRGQIKSEDCEPLENVEVEVWQAGSDGRYGNTSTTTPDDTCRGTIRTDKDGYFQFHTQLPGTFGLTSGTLFGGYMDISYWWPRSISVLLYKEGYEVLTTKLHFADDSFEGSNNAMYDKDPETGLYSRVEDQHVVSPKREYDTEPYAVESVRFVMTKADNALCASRTECAFEKYCREFDAPSFCMSSSWALETAAVGEKYGMDPLTMIFAGVFYVAFPIIISLNICGIVFGNGSKAKKTVKVTSVKKLN